MKQIYYTFFLVYLFSYVQISPAFQDDEYYNFGDDDFEDSIEYVEDSFEDPSIEDNHINPEDPKYEIDKRSVEIPLSRTKRFIGIFIAFIAGIVSAAAANVISEQVNGAINRANGRAGGATSKQSAIDKNINRNYNAALQFKNRLAKINPQAARALILSKKGFTCNTAFCKRFGAGQHSIGICSPFICHCSNGKPNKQTCGQGTVFDPIYKVCNWAYNVKICGA